MTARRFGIFGVLAAIAAIGIFVSNKLTKGLVWTFLTQRTDLLLTGAVAAGCAYVIVRSLIDLLLQIRAKRTVESARIAFAVIGGVVGLVGVWIYWRAVLSAPSSTLSFARHGTDYELLSPKMLGLALLAPFFFWMIGRSLADLPLPQRILSVILRIAFVALLALGLSRLARTATTQKIATVYLVDVSESVPDAALEDARAEITKGLKEKPDDAIVRVITFAKRPRVVTIAENTKEAPPLERHDVPPADAAPGKGASPKAARSGLGAATDIASAMQLAYGLYPSGYLRRAVVFSDGVQTDGDILAEANRARDFGVKVFTVPYHRPVPGEVALRDLRLPEKVRVGEPFNLHANIFSSRPQKVRATLKQGEAINGLDGIRDIDLKPGDNDVTFKSVVRVAGEVTYALDLSDIPEDRFRENNRFAVSVAVPGRPSVLYAEGNTARASYLAS
ncbi:MAG TPA: VWA domain-containing protein, partial [Labilithrix sp.]|nr:VWA domain-containing protein [Labilithrix sp.]